MVDTANSSAIVITELLQCERMSLRGSRGSGTTCRVLPVWEGATYR